LLNNTRLVNINQATPPSINIPKKPIINAPQFITNPWSGEIVGDKGRRVAVIVTVGEGEGVSVGK
jgi:hypothetical protein